MNHTAGSGDGQYSHRLSIILISTNIVFSIAANLIALQVVQRQRQIEDATRLLHRTFFSVNLALTVFWSGWDITLLVFSNIRACVLIYKVLCFPTFVCLNTLMFNMCLISIEKYIYISRPLRYHVHATITRMKILLLFVFVISCMSCLPYAVVANAIEDYPRIHCGAAQHVSHQYANTLAIVHALNQVLMYGNIVVTCGLTIVSNFAIVCIAYRRRQIDMARNHQVNDREMQNRGRLPGANVPVVENLIPRPMAPRRNRGVGSLLILTFFFYTIWMLWLPYALFPEELRGITDIFGANNGWLQPLAYIAVTKEARDIIKRKLKCGFMGI